MNKNATFINTKTKPVFSGHETFPMRYGWLKKIFDIAKRIEKDEKTTIKAFLNSDAAMIELGVGKNMVASMNHWAIYSGVFEVDENKDLKINSFADWIFRDDGKDPWMENNATLWFLHWNLVCSQSMNRDNLFMYYWFFNHYNFATFDKEIITKQVLLFLTEYLGADKIPASLTLGRDIDCFISMYSAKTTKAKSEEESIESPLVELGIIHPVTRRDIFQINRGVKPSLSINTFLFGLLMFWKQYSPNSKTLSFESICYQPMSPGRVFILNEDVVSEFMRIISKETDGLLEYSETA